VLDAEREYDASGQDLVAVLDRDDVKSIALTQPGRAARDDDADAELLGLKSRSLG
jgi:hypothetical protein